MTALDAESRLPTAGDLVRVRGQRWVVADADPAVIDLSSIEDGRYGQALSVVWAAEPDAAVIDTGTLPGPDDPDRPSDIAAFLDAARWSAATSADIYHLQAPFRAGVVIEDYQLEPLARALTAPRVNLLLADDVGLGKTIEAGLVALELLLRHRARTILIVCPAGLAGKWRDEMDEKFGLDFTIIDAAQCARLRRLRGSAANPFVAYPLAIVSLPWLRGARAQRLLDEVLPAEVDPRRRTFDLLILDEAHHVAPAAPKQRYAVDSQQTKLIRHLAPHCEHRLFLSATPHNGYRESFAALLELVDDQRFARGAPIDQTAQRETVIRRLKAEVRTSAGESFRPRRPMLLEAAYEEKDLIPYDLIERFVAARRAERRTSGRDNRRRERRGDVVALLLKKRLYSSPAAFAATVDVIRSGMRSPTVSVDDDLADDGADPLDDWTDDFLAGEDDRDTLDDDARREAENDAIRRASAELGAGASDSATLLEQMAAWAAPYQHRADPKARTLIDYLVGVCRPGKDWLNERVVVFTEYRDTQLWLEDLLRREGLTLDHRVALLHGGMAPDERETLRRRFQAAPGDDHDAKVRILLATDAAAEGIDLHWHCHRLVNYDIPFNPNRLEQRIGRIDRYGQTRDPEVRHFVAAGWDTSRNGFVGDLEFLRRVADKIIKVEADLGSANPVLAVGVQRRMLGQRITVADLDTEITGRRRGLGSDGQVREQIARLRSQLDATIDQLEIRPERVARVVETGMRLARQAPLGCAVDPDPVWDVPPLTGTWVRASERLAHPLRPDVQRPITFDPQIARDRREDVVFAHLNHPLVAMSTRMLTAAAASSQTTLSRATIVTSRRPDLTEPVAIGYARFLVIGGDAVRLHEEVVHAGGWIREDGRFARIENLTLLAEIASDALAGADDLLPHGLHERLIRDWVRTGPGVASAIDWRAATRRDQVHRALENRREAELQRNADNFDRFARTLIEAQTEPMLDVIPGLDPDEDAQRERDRKAVQERLERVPVERRDEADRIESRYSGLTEHTFPLAVVVVVPASIGSR